MVEREGLDLDPGIMSAAPGAAGRLSQSGIVSNVLILIVSKFH